jgi:hypothetical protein
LNISFGIPFYIHIESDHNVRCVVWVRLGTVYEY